MRMRRAVSNNIETDIDGDGADAARRSLKVCLAASGGGHLRQIVDLRPYWESRRYYLVTEPSALAQTLAKTHRIHFVPHFALGQSKMHSVVTMLRAGLLNFWASWRFARRERPDLVISTGAGSAFFSIFFAKIYGAKVVLVESFARQTAPSLFGRLTRPLADRTIVQSEKLLSFWPDAELCDPFVILGPLEKDKEDLAVVTVGTVLTFDRLVSAVGRLVEEGVLKSPVVAQVGKGGVRPAAIETREYMDFDELTRLLERANIVFCHGGTGSLVTALRAGCRIIAMSRQMALNENYDDHQQEIIDAFAERGLIQTATGADDLDDALRRALAADPVRATTDPVILIKRLEEIEDEWFPRSQGRAK